ncbi:MAG: hypothetical protein ACKOYO_05590 [Actinomycetota bacterium]
MNKVSVIARAAIVSGFLAVVAVPAANAMSDNEPNLGNSVENANVNANANSNSSRNDYWGGCNGVHGVDNPGDGLSGGLAGNSGASAEGNTKDWKQCSASGVAGASVPETR